MGVAGCIGGQEKEWKGCLLGDLRAFGINADQETIAGREGMAQDGRTRGGTFHDEIVTAAAKAMFGLRHAVV